MEKKLEVKDLVISFRTQGGKLQAVRKISFDLYKGETLAIVGESGSGKSVTNRAIMGISAGNAIIEGGEIFYDGKDLLKISEEDFHKIRGDKIAMIFQDPMSSLNPIMKVGRQLTEAMILKSRAASRNARRDFNSKLALLNKNMNEYSNFDEEEVKKYDVGSVLPVLIFYKDNNEYKRLPLETKNKLVAEDKIEIKDLVPNPILIRNKNNIDIITEKTLHQLILEDIESFMKELGNSFSFIGSEYKIKIGDRNNYIDLLLFNIKYNCYVVVELKVKEFK